MARMRFTPYVRMAQRLRQYIYWQIVDLVYVLDLAEATLPTPSKGRAEIRPITPEDAAALAKSFGETRTNDLMRRLSACHGVAAWVDQKIIGFAWLTEQARRGEGEPPFLYDISPKPGWGYTFDLYVAADGRGQGLATMLKAELVRIAKLRGLHCLVSTHDVHNHSAVRVSEKLGFRLRGRLYFRRILWRQRVDLKELPEGVTP